MATVIQGNGLKPLVNGAMVHLEVDSGAIGHQLVRGDAQNMHGNQTDNMCVRDASNMFIQGLPNQYELGPNDIKKEPSCDEPEVDIVINNVVCSFSVRCHLNLRQIALQGCNVEYRKENGMVTMKLRKPYTTASIWSSGKITCTGATTEEMSRVAARRYARALQKLGFKTRFTNFRVVNVLGTCSMPFAIKITAFTEKHREAEYEPELHPGVTFKMKKPKATLKIFSTGSITVTAPSVSEVQQAIEAIYPLVFEFRKERTKEEELALEQKHFLQARKRKMLGAIKDSSDESECEDSWN